MHLDMFDEPTTPSLHSKSKASIRSGVLEALPEPSVWFDEDISDTHLQEVRSRQNSRRENAAQERTVQILACVACLFFALTVLFVILYASAKRPPPEPQPTNTRIIPIFLSILQTNDIYEMKPMAGLGGFSHLAALRKSLQGEHVLSVFAGDLIAPSPLSLIPIRDQQLLGKHMIDLANDLFDMSALGNHEFDYGPEVLKERLSESRFPWLRTNLPSEGIFVDLDKKGVTKEYEIRSFKVPSSYVASLGTLRVAFVGLAKHIEVKNMILPTMKETFQKLPQTIERIRKEHDPHLIIAITHFDLSDDVQLAAADLGIDLIIGGHEHENIVTFRPPHQVPITKADSDARSAFIHKVYLFEPQVEPSLLHEHFPHTPTVLRRSDVTIVVDRFLQEVNTSMPSDPEMEKKVNTWWDHARIGFEEAGYNPDELVYNLRETWDLRREHLSGVVGTVEGKVFVDAVLSCGQSHFGDKTTRLAVFSSGQVRIDALITPRKLTVYDIFRMSPFFGDITRAKVRVSKLIEAMKVSVTENVGQGGFLLWSDNLSCNLDHKKCTLDRVELAESDMVPIFTMSFLLTGKERNMSIFKEDKDNIVNNGEQNELGKTIHFQRCVIDHLKNAQNA